MSDGLVSSLSGGRITLASRGSTIASPIASLAGAGGLFTLPAAISLPANFIPDHSLIMVQGWVKRRAGTGATADFEAYIGTAGAASDSLIGRVTVNATANHVGWLLVHAIFGTSATVFIGNGSVVPMSSSGGTSFIDRNTQFNRASAMSITLGMPTVNAADTFDLVGYQVTLLY